MKKIGVVLSGCGVFDGSEIHEAVFTLLALDQAGVQIICMAPNMEVEEVNHLTKSPTGKKRNVLEESARIARGNIVDIAKIKSTDVAALIFPGGFGAVKNLSDFASKGAQAKAHPEVSRLVKEMVQAKKPIGVICIAPAMLATILGSDIAPILTIGSDVGTAQMIEALGAKHIHSKVEEIVVDEKNKIVSTSAYMCARSIKEAAIGIEKLVKKIVAIS